MFSKIHNQVIKSFIVVLLISISLGTSLVLGESFIDNPLPSFNAVTPYVVSNKYTQMDTLEVATSQMEIYSDAILINTEIGTVYLDPSALSFQIVNTNGYIWSSTVDVDASTLSPNWKKRVRSAIHIESFNSKQSSFTAVEEYILSDGTTKANKIITNGFESVITFGKSKIKILLRVRFLKSGITVEIPDSGIIEDGDYKIANISVYPYFGAVLEDSVPGYIFVPDGIGALVRYQKANPAIISNYRKEIFGRNLSYNTETNLHNFREDAARIYAPVFGFVHGINQNAVFGNIIKGSEYGMLNISYAGRINNYNTIYSQYVYRRTYLQPIDMAGNTIAILQAKRHSYDIEINYSLLENNDANYVGMAKTYRDYLKTNNEISDKTSTKDNIPLKVDSLGIVKAEGQLFNQTIVMTTFSDLTEIIKDLNQRGINNIVLGFSGYSSNGINWSAPKYDNLSSRVGNKRSLNELAELLEDFYLVGDYQAASTKSGGYNTYSDLAKKINDQHYEYMWWGDKSYLLNHKKTVEMFDKSIEKLSQYSITGISSTTLGARLYEDFSSEVNLTEAINIYNEMLDASNLKVGLSDANSYAWKNMDAYFDFPMYSSQYLQFSDTVPFLGIALNGSLDLYASSANFYAYAKDELLRLIDFGVNPSFILTKESSLKLEDTSLRHIYSSRYKDLSESVTIYYDFVNTALKHVNTSSVESRTVIDNGQVVIVYDNGISILVNYTDKVVNHNTYQVKPKNFIVFDSTKLIAGNYEGGK